MYRLDETKVKGLIKIRKEDGTRIVKRARVREILAEQIKNEKDEVRRYDYLILMDAIVGLDSLLLEKREIKVVYNEEYRWRGESEAIITNNKTLLKILGKVFDSSPIF